MDAASGGTFEVSAISDDCWEEPPVLDAVPCVPWVFVVLAPQPDKANTTRAVATDASAFFMIFIALSFLTF